MSLIADTEPSGYPSSRCLVPLFSVHPSVLPVRRQWKSCDSTGSPPSSSLRSRRSFAIRW